jgi:hypothetical protein
VNLMKILLVGLFALALVIAAMCTGPMSAGTVALVTVQTLPTPPVVPAGSTRRNGSRCRAR